MIGHDVERGNNFTTCGSSETTRDIFFLTTEVLTLRRYSYARKGGHINRDAITSNYTQRGIVRQIVEVKTFTRLSEPRFYRSCLYQ